MYKQLYLTVRMYQVTDLTGSSSCNGMILFIFNCPVPIPPKKNTMYNIAFPPDVRGRSPIPLTLVPSFLAGRQNRHVRQHGSLSNRGGENLTQGRRSTQSAASPARGSKARQPTTTTTTTTTTSASTTTSNPHPSHVNLSPVVLTLSATHPHVPPTYQVSSIAAAAHPAIDILTTTGQKSRQGLALRYGHEIVDPACPTSLILFSVHDTLMMVVVEYNYNHNTGTIDITMSYKCHFCTCSIPTYLSLTDLIHTRQRRPGQGPSLSLGLALMIMKETVNLIYRHNNPIIHQT
ncbi:hypothetical protein DFH27DRAFT_525373 [Peziza echinospora]|nr:hypothetical protein DFH27DRAFT_525373 [Peziza echinospora]